MSRVQSQLLSVANLVAHGRRKTVWVLKDNQYGHVPYLITVTRRVIFIQGSAVAEHSVCDSTHRADCPLLIVEIVLSHEL